MKTLASLIARHNVQAIAIGNGTASRETAAFVQDFLRQANLTEIFSVTVSESGASVYSASEIARQEFPDLDLTVRGAISIARRLQDPLAELVKVDPKSIGVGQYQHDVDQRRLKQSLEATVESCVNRVGVDLTPRRGPSCATSPASTNAPRRRSSSTATSTAASARACDLTAVPGFGPKTFEQAAGFLRIRGGDNPLDMTAVHPESYPVVEQIADIARHHIDELIAQAGADREGRSSKASPPSRSACTRWATFAKSCASRDATRATSSSPPKWRDDVREIADLKPGMTLEGVVTNVTRFGAFVDVGVHQDGLVHISELANRFVKEASEVVKVGQIVKVQVLSADAKAKAHRPSMKALDAAPPEPKRKLSRTRGERSSRRLTTSFRR